METDEELIARIRRGDEAGLLGHQRCPGTAGTVARCQHQEGKLRVELPMLLRQLGTNDPTRPGLDFVANPELCLNSLLSLVEGRRRRRLAGPLRLRRQ